MELQEREGKIYVVLTKAEFLEISAPYIKEGSAKMIAREQIRKEYENKLNNLGIAT